jgi:hypothetical protein
MPAQTISLLRFNCWYPFQFWYRFHGKSGPVSEYLHIRTKNFVTLIDAHALNRN